MLKCLLNKKFNCISRASDMLCLFVGDDYTFVSRGREINVADFSLHIQTQWRFTKDDAIILGSHDIYEPYSHSVPDNWEYDIFGRKDEESSIFDVISKTLNVKMSNAIVLDVAVSTFGDIRIAFSNGVLFEAFTFASRKAEVWRLIDYKTHTHTVFYDMEE
ncbi:MAG: hypothetical protein HDT30_10825 [Clostridiales bacterium]|nr:hypothetical protein [Clostridiales bacterium]